MRSEPIARAWASARRPAIPFRSVNRGGSPGHVPELQRHHLLPLQLLSATCFARMFERIGRRRAGFDDFRANGLLLPASEAAAIRFAMPLHRGPHRDYNAMVIARVGQIECRWSSIRLHDPEAAMCEALFRLQLLQAALRRRLLEDRRRLVLNRLDPLGTGFDFAELDRMAEALWQASRDQEVQAL